MPIPTPEAVPHRIEVAPQTVLNGLLLGIPRSWALLWCMLACMGWLVVGPNTAQAQQPYSLNRNLFAIEFAERLEETGKAEALEFSKTFLSFWESGYLSTTAQNNILRQMNRLVEKNFYPWPDQAQYFRVLFNLGNPEHKFKFNLQNYLDVTDSALKYLDKGATLKYLKTIEDLVPEGFVFKVNYFGWALAVKDPRLEFESGINAQTGAPEYRAIIRLINTDVIYQSKDDTSAFTQVYGYVDLSTKILHAKTGTYDWRRLGVPPTEIWAELGNFKADLKLRSFRVDSCVLHYPSFLPFPLRGELDENIDFTRNPEDATHPYFKSHEGGIEIDDFIENVKYTGGFSMRGITKIGSRTPFNLAMLQIYSLNGIEVLRLKADEFALNPRLLLTSKSEVTMYLPGGDSLYHPSMKLIYFVDKRDMILRMDAKSPFSRQPILSSYHNFNLYFEEIKWNTQEDTLRFSATIDNPNKYLAIESYDFFRRDRYRQYKALLSFHPMSYLLEYVLEMTTSQPGWNYQEEWINLQKFCEKYKLKDPELGIELAFQDLWADGFIDYKKLQFGAMASGFEDIYIRVKPRLIDWARAARTDAYKGKKVNKDFDALIIITNTYEPPNAILSYSSKDFRLFGTLPFALSDSDYVVIFPQDSTILVTDNRTVHYGGKMLAGKIDLYGKGTDKFVYEYNKHKVLCNQIDSLKFSPRRDPNYDPWNHNADLMKALERLKIEGVRGAVYVNKPNNHSAREPHYEYPVFDCYTQAYVYWDGTDVQGGLYGRDLIKYTVDPFVLDSLETFTIEGLEFYGEFSAGDIMPAFEDTLKPVADNTYGIQQQMPEDGVPLYVDKGQLYGEVIMDGYGLHANGQIDFIGTTAESDTFLFFNDSVISVTRMFHLQGGLFEGVKFPDVKNAVCQYKWYPRAEKLVVSTLNDAMPFQMFGGEGAFVGDLVITPQGVTGSGTITLNNVQIASTSFEFDEMDFKATEKGTTFALTYDGQPKKLHFKATDVMVDYSVTKHEADFQTLGGPGQSNLEFVQHQYVTSLAKGHFTHATQHLHLDASETFAAKHNFFKATDPKRKDLTFTAGAADYNLLERRILIDGTDSMEVADVVIFPDEGKVAISPQGEVEKIVKCTIIATQASRNHELFDATVDVFSSEEYKGYAQRVFIESEGKDQVIYFNTLGYVPADTTSRARGIITEADQFFITDRIFFKGEVNMTAADKYMHFKGFVKIKTSKPWFTDSWLPFEDVVNPDSIFIPFKAANKTLTVGVHYWKQYRMFYTNFLQKKRNTGAKADADVLLAEGGLSVDRQSLSFVIGPRDKLRDQVSYRGNIVSYNDETDIYTARGFFDLPYHKPENNVLIETAGYWREDLGKKKITTDWVMAIDFKDLGKNIQDELGKRLASLLAAKMDADLTRRLVQESIAELIDRGAETEVNTKKFVQQVEKAVFVADIKVAPLKPVTWLLADVNFRYHDSLRAFYESDTITVLGVYGRSINKQVNAKMEYAIGKALPNGTTLDDTLTIFLEIDDNNYVFFRYYGMDLFVGSTFSDLNSYVLSYIANQNDPKKQKKGKGPDPIKLHAVSRDAEVQNWLTKFAAKYFSAEYNYDYDLPDGETPAPDSEETDDN